MTFKASGIFFNAGFFLVHTSYSFVLKLSVGICVAREAPGWRQSKSSLRTDKTYVRHSRPNTKETKYVSVNLTIRVAFLVIRNNVKVLLRPRSRNLVALSPTYVHLPLCASRCRMPFIFWFFCPEAFSTQHSPSDCNLRARPNNCVFVFSLQQRFK